MKNTLIILVMMLAFCIGGSCQNKACDLLNTAQINAMLSVNVKDGRSMMQDKYCVHKADDNRIQVIVQYIDFSSPQAAQQMLKTEYDENVKAINAGKKAAGLYTAIKSFSDAGTSSYYMTAPGSDFVPGNSVRFQFVLGKSLFSFDTQSIDMNKVVPKLALAYKTIKDNYKM